MKNTVRRILCGITAFAVTAGVMSYFPAESFSGTFSGLIAHAEGESWRVSVGNSLDGIAGDGTEASPYQITNAEQLNAVLSNSGVHAVLMNDIVLNADLLNRIDTQTGEPLDPADTINDWTANRNVREIYFDGNGHTISGIFFSSSKLGYSGLISELYEGELKNFNITDSFVFGLRNTGALIGSVTDVNISNIIVSNVVVRAVKSDVKGATGEDVGGVLGLNHARKAENITVENAVVSGEDSVGGYSGTCSRTSSNGAQDNINIVVRNSQISGTTNVGGAVGYLSTAAADNMTIESDVRVTGDTNIGGAFGTQFGYAINIRSGATVNGTSNVGGISGSSSRALYNSYNTGKVTGETNVGGVLGCQPAPSAVDHIYNIGIVTGNENVAGIVGGGCIHIANSYNAGEIVCNGAGPVSALANYTLTTKWDTYPIKNNYYLESTTVNTPFYSTYSGQVETLKAQSFTEDQLHSGELAYTMGYASKKWVQDLSVSDGHPTFGDEKYLSLPARDGSYHNHLNGEAFCDKCWALAWEPPKGGNNYYQISNPHELIWFSEHLGRAQLVNDIVMNEDLLDRLTYDASGNVTNADEFIPWTPIGYEDSNHPFHGTFDGQGHTVSGLFVNGENSDGAGLFGYISAFGWVEGVGVTDSYFKADKYVGEIAARTRNRVVSCFAYNTKQVGTSDATKINHICSNGTYATDVASCYYLSDSHEVLAGTTNCGGMTEADFKSGKVAFYLDKYYGDNHKWGQMVSGDDKDDLPAPYTTANRLFSGATGTEDFHNHADGAESCDKCGELLAIEPEYDQANHVYLISTASELLWFQQRVNSGTYSGNYKSAVLISDIILNDDINAPKFEWVPIGTDSSPYYGTFNGQGHTVKGVYVDKSGENDIGLFGVIGETTNYTGCIKNLSVTDSKLVGGNNVGGVVGRISGGAGVKSCYFTGTITSDDSKPDKVVGGSDKTGNLYGSSGEVLEASDTQLKSGELVDLLNGSQTPKVWGELIGTDMFPRTYTAENEVFMSFPKDGWHNHAGGTTADSCDLCPAEPQLENGVYQIGTLRELYWFAGLVNGKLSGIAADTTANAVLTSDIAVNEAVNSREFNIWTPIGSTTASFDGSFDGNGHYISGLVKSDGLFGSVGSSGAVMNIGVVNSVLNNNGAGIAAENLGSIRDSFIYGIKDAGSQPVNVIANDSGSGGTVNCYNLTDAQIESGEAAYILNSDAYNPVWGFEIGKDALPTALNSANRVFKGKSAIAPYHNHEVDLVYCDNCSEIVSTKPVKTDGCYQISTPAELVWFAKWTNGNIDGNTHSDSAKLLNNIDLSSFSGLEWTPVGVETAPFTGSFDGNGNTISGLTITDPTCNSAGLFGYLGSGAAIQDLIVTNCRFTGSTVGVISGSAAGEVTISHCGTFGNSVTGTTAADFVGVSSADITVSHSFAAGTIDGFANLAANARLICRNSWFMADIGEHTMTAADFAGGKLAYSLNKNNTGMPWGQKLGTDTYPVLNGDPVKITSPCVSYTNGSTSKPHDIGDDGRCKVCGEYDEPEFTDGKYQIKTLSQLLWYADHINKGNSDEAVLCEDITLNDRLISGNSLASGSHMSWTPIGSDSKPFSGTFDGAGHKISGLFINDANAGSGGLFGCIDGGKVSNLRLEDSYFLGSKSIGGICGRHISGTIENCAVDSVIIIGNASGGIVGDNSGSVSDVFFSGKVTGTNSGSLCGVNSGNIRNALSITAGAVCGRNQGSGKLSGCFYNSDLAKEQELGTGLDSRSITGADIVSKLGSRWGKAENTTKQLYYPELSDFRTDKYTIGVEYELSLVNTDNAPAYMDTLHFTFDVLSAPETSDEKESILASLTLNGVCPQHFSFCLDGKALDIDAGSIYGGYLDIVLDGEKIGTLSVDSAMKIAAVIDYPLSAGGQHTISVTYNGRKFDYLTGKSAECSVTIKKAIPVITEPAASVVYGQSLAEAKLTEGWSWQDDSIVPTPGKNKCNAVMKADDTENYDYSNVQGFSARTKTVTREVSVSLKKASPEITISHGSGYALPGSTVSVSAAVKNPYNAKLMDVPEAELFVTVGNKEAKITSGKLEVPKTLAEGTVITITARTAESRLYKSAEKTAEITVSAHNWSSEYKSDKYGHWHWCLDCGMTSEKQSHVSSGKATTEKAEICTVCGYEIAPKRTSGGSGGSGGGNPRPTQNTDINPAINGVQKPWSEIASDLAKQNGGSVVITLNGNTLVPADVIKAIAGNKIVAEFVFDSIKSWIVDGSRITEVSESNLSLYQGNSNKDALRGTFGVDLKVSGTKVPAALKLNFRANYAGQFANVYAVTDSRLVFQSCVSVNENGSATITGADSSCEYIVMVCEYSDLPGDMTNDGVLNALDASAILKSSVGADEGANPKMGDYNGDGAVNALDASAVLKHIVGIAA